MVQRKKKEEPKNESSFDVKEAIKRMDIPESVKMGFNYYLVNNNITINSENELSKTYDNFMKMSIGV